MLAFCPDPLPPQRSYRGRYTPRDPRSSPVRRSLAPVSAPRSPRQSLRVRQGASEDNPADVAAVVVGISSAALEEAISHDEDFVDPVVADRDGRQGHGAAVSSRVVVRHSHMLPPQQRQCQGSPKHQSTPPRYDELVGSLALGEEVPSAQVFYDDPTEPHHESGERQHAKCVERGDCPPAAIGADLGGRPAEGGTSHRMFLLVRRERAVPRPFVGSQRAVLSDAAALIRRAVCSLFVIIQY